MFELEVQVQLGAFVGGDFVVFFAFDQLGDSLFCGVGGLEVGNAIGGGTESDEVDDFFVEGWCGACHGICDRRWLVSV